MAKHAPVLALAILFGVALAGCLGDGPDTLRTGGSDQDATRSGGQEFVPHVIVGIPDTGINPYHEMYFRPNLTMHPCTYIRDFPCDIEALPLSVGGDDWDAAFEADRELWDQVERGTWYWIPRTVFVAVYCEAPYSPSGGDICILDDSHMHGTGTTSSVLMENPDALIAFKEGGSGVAPFLRDGIPVDILSVSWGYSVPMPAPGAFNYAGTPIYFKAAGNDPRTTSLDAWSGHPAVISVGGAYSADNSEELMASKQADIVSYYCRPTAQTKSIDGMRSSYCGTSFAAPTAAGALSKVIYGLRIQSGYDGTIVDGMVDPVLGISVADLRDAMNRTASYDPDAQYPNTSSRGVPLNPAAPWLQWGWGFYDGPVADATLAHLLGEATSPDKPEAAKLHMAAVYAGKQAVYG